MIPRHPLIFKVTVICATVMLLGILFFSRESNIIINRSLLLVTEEPVPTLDEAEFERLLKEEAEPVVTESTTTTELPVNKHLKYVDGESLTFELDQEPCSDEDYLAIYVHSGPENAERRRVIRNNWGSNDILQKHKAKLIFVTGQVDDDNIQASLQTESELYRDLIQSNFSDTYRNLTYKAVAGMKWVSENCPNTVYVLKTDDDIVVDIHRVVRLMKSYIEHKWGKENILAGYIWPHMNVDRNKSSKWFTSEEEFPSKFFLKYCSGSAYLMSTDVVKKFYNKSLETPFFWVDDYFVTGLLAHGTNIIPTSLNDRYILENTADMGAALKNDTKTRYVYVHSPDSPTSNYVWQQFLDRW